VSPTPREAKTPEERRAALRIGMTLGGRWLIERVLGVGGMAAVYAVRAPDGTTAALKLLHPEHAIRAEIRERFLREGLAANRVGHPGAVQVLDSATLEDEETAYLVMELLDGESLGERRARAALTTDELLDVLDQTLDVLAAAHERGIVHRDLKPDNIMFRSDGSLALIDFGIAREASTVTTITRQGQVLGTPYYISPEQCLDQPVDGRADVYSAGVIFYEALTGDRPFKASSIGGLLHQQVHLPPPPLPASLQRYQGLIEHLLAKSAEQRLTAAELLAVLKIDFALAA
jgi:serine/threonine-protein kinase